MKIALCLIAILFSFEAFAEPIYLVQGGLSQLNGNVYIGGEKTSKAQFDSYNLEAQLITSNNWIFGLSYDQFDNNRSVKNSQFSASFGYNFNFDKINLALYGGPGYANYTEHSSLQSINAESIALRMAVSASVDVYEGLFLQLNYKYLHQMYTDGYNYWGQNPRSDVVFDVNGLGIGIGWKWQ